MKKKKLLLQIIYFILLLIITQNYKLQEEKDCLKDIQQSQLENMEKIQKLKTIKKVFTPKLQPEGDGAMVRRVIGGRDIQQLNPFLMLDFFSLKLPAGFPDHPHRGFQTVTYLQKGSMYHEDFKGNKGKLLPGDIQWMTAGKGIVHAEMPGSFDEITEGFQLWINLAAKNKYCEPNYQEISSEKIPVVKKDGITIKLIAGEAFGQKGPIHAETPAYYLDVQMEKNTVLQQKIPANWNSLAFIYQGNGSFDGLQKQIVQDKQAILFNNEDNDVLQVNSGEQGCSFMLMAGQPINEPIVQYGPFVLNNESEVQKAFQDYQGMKNGFEQRNKWESKIQDMANK